MAFYPSGASSSVVVNMSKFSAAKRARWYDLTNGSYTLISSSISNTGNHTFTNPGNNSAGDSDWVLILD